MRHDHHTRPFGFDRIFAAASHPEASRQDLELQLAMLQAENAERAEQTPAALARARDDGFAAGLAQARAEIAAALAQASGAIDAGLVRLAANLDSIEARIAAGAAEATLAAAELIAARAIETDVLLPVEAAIGRVVAQLGRGVALAIRVHPSLLAQLQARLAASATANRRPALHFDGDTALAPGDAVIDWESGGLTLDRAARVAAVAAALGLPLPGGTAGFGAENERQFQPDDELAAVASL
jgi:flagellar assembly protein FliH